MKVPDSVEFEAREICRKAGYDPDQLVISLDNHKDFDYLYIGLAPVDVSKLQPMFMKFINEAKKIIAQKGQNPSGAPAHCA